MNARSARAVSYALMIGSGFAGLGLQIVWTQQGALALGHEAASVLAVVAAFFGGISLGAFALGERIARSARPGRWYAACEAVIGAWAIVLAFAFTPLSTAWASWLPLSPSPLIHWIWIFVGAFAGLMPATVAMGATLPAIERVLAHAGDGRATIAPLYAANTAGAVVGALAAAFVLIPAFGLRATALLCAATNLACALAAIRGFDATIPALLPPPRDGLATLAHSAPPARAPLVTLAATGALGIGYEVLVVRALSHVAENTVYTFAILLSIYLIGTTLGAAAYARRHGEDEHQTRDRLAGALAIACLFGAGVLAGAGPLKQWIAPQSFRAALGVEALLGLGSFLPATICMGALFSHLSGAATRGGVPFARCLAVNTLGAALAPLALAAAILGGASVRTLLIGVTAAYLLTASSRAWLRPAQQLAAVTVAAAALWLPAPDPVDVPPGGHIVRTIEGPLSTVSVVADAADVATLHIDNKQQEGSSATVFADARQGVLPLLLHPAAHRALFLGLGTGVTSRAASLLAEVDVVELLPEVIAASSEFDATLRVSRPPRRIPADARRFVRDARERYDVIVADNFHPARSGSGTLYTVEHFRAVRARLADDGVFCQWLPLHQLDLATLRSIARSYLDVYPHASAVLATHSLETPVIGLLSSRDGAPFDVHLLSTHFAASATRDVAAQFGFPDEVALLGGFIAGPDALRRFAADAPLNTDDRPVVTYSAPRITYEPATSPRTRLLALLQTVHVAPDEVFAHATEHGLSARVAAYWRARDRYLVAGRDVRPVADVHAMLAQVRAPLLEVVRLSPDFRPAYDPLLAMAARLADTDAPAARALLEQLAAAAPLRPEAPRALLAMGQRL